MTRNFDDRETAASADDATDTVAAHVRAKLGELSPGERKVGRALLAAYPIAGLETVAGLAKRAGVSAPTVLRFTARLGFPSYPAMQNALHREVHARMGAPTTDTARARPEQGIQATHERFADALSATFTQLPEAELRRAAELLAAPRARVHLLGGCGSRGLAQYLTDRLISLRHDVCLVPTDELQRHAVLLDVGRRDVLVLFDYRDYNQANVCFARRARRNEARLVLCTDPWLSPAAEFADVVLPARVEGVTAFDSFVPMLAVVETLAAEVAVQIGSPAQERMRALRN